jgi:hypothetical protein
MQDGNRFPIVRWLFDSLIGVKLLFFRFRAGTITICWILEEERGRGVTLKPVVIPALGVPLLMVFTAEVWTATRNSVSVNCLADIVMDAGGGDPEGRFDWER